MKLLFGEWAELGESMIPMCVFVCPNCGKIELYATVELREQAINAAYSTLSLEKVYLLLENS